MKRLIVNADDFGYSEGINQGIIEAHRKGIVTSTSLIVDAKAAKHGIGLIKNKPKLGLGLHFKLNIEEIAILHAKEIPDNDFFNKVNYQFLEQVKKFKELTRENPDHIDVHKIHINQLGESFKFIKNWCAGEDIPFRSQVNSIESFFGFPDEESISLNSLKNILVNLPEGDSELMCHPGIITNDFISSYVGQREKELKVLTSKEIMQEINKQKIRLINWSEL